MVRAEELLECHKTIAPHIHRTPVLTSRLLDQMVGASLYFKCENFQRMGAFKIRGAIQAIMQLPEEKRAKGVVTHSSGNFAQALSLAAQSLGVKAYIVMPRTATAVKKRAVIGYGGEVYDCDPNLQARESLSKEIEEKTGATFIHPSNDMNVILGNSTAATELLQDYPDLEVILCPVGGGGLVAGTALSAHFFGKNCRVIGAEPMKADDAYRSFHSGKIESNETADTVADGLRTMLGDINFPIIRKYVSAIERVEEEDIVPAMRLIWERLKITAEPSCAVPFAAALQLKEELRGKKVGIIISGGNVDLENLPF